MDKLLSILLIILCLGNPVYAANVEMLLSSEHTSDTKYNEQNYGLIVEHDNGLTYGIYKNSEYNTSVLLGYTFKLYEGDWFEYSLTTGLVTGYEYNDVIPSATLNIKIKDKVYLHIIPGATSS